MFYPVGQRVRIIGSVSFHYLVGMTGTVIGPPKSCSAKTRHWWQKKRRWVGQPVDVDNVGNAVPDPVWPGETCSYCPSPEQLKPLEDDGRTEGSWESVKEATNWSPSKKISA